MVEGFIYYNELGIGDDGWIYQNRGGQARLLGMRSADDIGIYVRWTRAVVTRRKI